MVKVILYIRRFSNTAKATETQRSNCFAEEIVKDYSILGIKLYCRLQRPVPAQFPGDALRKRRRKTAFSHKQLYRLEESFEKDRFPGIQIREELARELNIGRRGQNSCELFRWSY